MMAGDSVDWFDALGSPMPEDQREAARQEARQMGVEVGEDAPWVDHVAEHVERDRPKQAIESTRVHLDLTGTYRFLAALCVPVEDQEES